MAHWMVSTHDALSFSVSGRQYSTNENGMVEVDGADVDAAIQHGFRLAGADEAARAGVASAKAITPSQIASMDRNQLIAYLEANDVEEDDMPKRTSDLRGMAMHVADEEADAEAGVEEAKEEVEIRKTKKANKRERLAPPEEEKEEVEEKV